MQDSGHRLGKLLLVSVSGIAGRLSRLTAVYTYDIADKTSDQVVFQRNVALLHDVLFLCHLHAIDAYNVTPLITVVIALVTLAITTETVHVLIQCLRLKQYICGPAHVIAPRHRCSDAVHLHCVCRFHFTKSVQFDHLRLPDILLVPVMQRYSPPALICLYLLDCISVGCMAWYFA